jgi:hypothetical protein
VGFQELYRRLNTASVPQYTRVLRAYAGLVSAARLACDSCLVDYCDSREVRSVTVCWARACGETGSTPG